MSRLFRAFKNKKSKTDTSDFPALSPADLTWSSPVPTPDNGTVFVGSVQTTPNTPHTLGVLVETQKDIERETVLSALSTAIASDSTDNHEDGTTIAQIHRFAQLAGYTKSVSSCRRILDGLIKDGKVEKTLHIPEVRTVGTNPVARYKPVEQ